MINTFLVLCLLGSSLAGVVIYGLFAPWYRSTVGWSMMGLLIALAGITAAMASLYLFGQYDYRTEIMRAGFILMILVVIGFDVNMIREQLKSRRK